MSFVKVASKSEVESGSGKVVNVNGKEIAVLNDNGKFFAVDNTCKHMGGPLGEGSCKESKVTCPWHGWAYDLKTGKNTYDPNIKLDVYEVKVQGNDILVSTDIKK